MEWLGYWKKSQTKFICDVEHEQVPSPDLASGVRPQWQLEEQTSMETERLD